MPMEVIKALAKDVYRYGGLPKGVELEQEIPVEIRFDLSDLNPEKGYVITPVDELFRGTVKKLGIPFRSINLGLRRSNDLLTLLPPAPLRFLAGIEQRNNVPSVEYNRHLPFEPFFRYSEKYCFDFLDTGEINLETFLKECIMSKPGEESLKICLGNAELLLLLNIESNYDYKKQRLELAVSQIKDLNRNLHDSGVRFSKSTIDLINKKPEECANIAEQVLDYFISQGRY